MQINALTYQTILEPCKGIYKDKGSKFIAFGYPVKSEQEIKSILDAIKKEYFDARHHCFAYRLGAEKNVFRIYDDGEPSGTAGKPIFGQILSFDLTNILIIVVRYFGGTLLGTSGLINAYKHATADALSNAKIHEFSVSSVYQCNFNYPEMNAIMKIVKDFNIVTDKQVFDLECSIILKIKKNDPGNIIEKLEKIHNISLQYLYDE